MKLFYFFIIFMIYFSLFPAPGYVNYRGKLYESGQPADGSRNMQFRIYDAPALGNLKWDSGVVSVAVAGSQYAFPLGSNVSFPPGLFTNSALYLEVTVAGTILAPRERLVSVPYALEADTLDGYDSFDFLTWSRSGQNIFFTNGNVGIGTNDPQTKLDLGGDGAILARGTYSSGWTEPALGAGLRMLWYPRKGAFRAGRVTGAQWDDSVLGGYSTAFGYNTTASNLYSLAAGYGTVAGGSGSFAMGYASRALGSYSTAFGYNAFASNSYSVAGGYNASALGSYATAFGLETTASNTATTALGYYSKAMGTYSSAFGSYISVTGNYSMGLGLDGVSRTLSQPNTLAIVGGFVGIGTVAPSAALHIDSGSNYDAIKITNQVAYKEISLMLLDESPTAGYAKGIGSMAVYNENWFLKYGAGVTDWGALVHENSVGNVGIGTLTPRTRLELSNDGALLAVGTYASGWTESSLGAGTRMLWYPRKGAFRSGTVTGTQWDDAAIGAYSTALGYNTIASNSGSTAFGYNSTAGGLYSFAAGYNCYASNSYAVALGYSTLATGSGSFAVGYDTSALYAYSIAVGRNAIASNTGAVSIGYYTGVYGTYSTAIGYYTIANGSYASALGSRITVDGNYSFGIGLDSTTRNVVQSNTLAIMGGKVGIANLAPEYELDVTGSAQVSGEYRFASAKTYYYRVPASAFMPVYPSNYTCHQDGYWYALSGSGAMIMTAPVNLPQGAYVNGLTLYFYGNGGGFGACVSLKSRGNTALAASVVGSQGTNGSFSPLASMQSISGTVNSYIDNSANEYFVYAALSGSGGISYRIYGAVLSYTLTNVSH